MKNLIDSLVWCSLFLSACQQAQERRSSYEKVTHTIDLIASNYAPSFHKHIGYYAFQEVTNKDCLIAECIADSLALELNKIIVKDRDSLEKWTQHLNDKRKVLATSKSMIIGYKIYETYVRDLSGGRKDTVNCLYSLDTTFRITDIIELLRDSIAY